MLPDVRKVRKCFGQFVLMCEMGHGETVAQFV